MNKSIYIVIGASLVMVGCAQQTVLLTAQQCKSIAIPAACSGEGGNPKVEINTNTMTVDNANVCANRSRIIQFDIEPTPAEEGTVAVVPKDEEDTWLVGTNTGNAGQIKIKVPHWVTQDSNHDYSIITRDGDCLDPRVRVR